MRTRIVFFLLLALALALYANALRNDFVFDDASTLCKTSAIKSLETLPDLFVGPGAAYRPIRYLSFALDYAISGERPWAYHLLNSIYHAITAFLVFVLLRRLAGEGRAALVGALIFVVHPVHTESVAYISGRRDLLSTLFYLAALLAYFRHADTGRLRYLLAALASFGLALGSKEMAVTLPAVIVLHDLLLAPVRPPRRRIAVYAAFFAIAGLASAMAIFGGASGQVAFYGDSAAVNFMTVARLLVHYAGLLVAPVTLVADYTYETFPLSKSIFEPRTLAAIALIAGAAAVAVGCRRRAPRLAFGIAWFFVTLLPVSHIVPFHELAAEHYLYLPSVGLCLIAGIAVERARRRAGSRVAYAALALVLLAFSTRTVVRNRDWRDAETLWRATIEAAPRCARAQFNLGNIYANMGELDRALPYHLEALRIKPDYVFARVRLGHLYAKMGRPAEAKAEWEEALRTAKSLRKSPVHPAHICMLLGRTVEAILLLEADQRAHPERIETLLELAACYEGLRNDRAALGYYDQVLARRPDHIGALARAAILAERLGDHGRAVDLAARARSVSRRGGGSARP